NNHLPSHPPSPTWSIIRRSRRC
ncbi:MAG: hypothetical protein AVDCRST_MAG18-380, partial [uncultured Thermomicrobiales bacterium]